MAGTRRGHRRSHARTPLPLPQVTGLPVPAGPSPHPEVFQDSLHTYKLNEQDTDAEQLTVPPPRWPHRCPLILALLVGAFPVPPFSSPAPHTSGPVPSPAETVLSTRAPSAPFSSSLLTLPGIVAACFSTECEAFFVYSNGPCYFRHADFGRK